jgi:hypothetical protein
MQAIGGDDIVDLPELVRRAQQAADEARSLAVVSWIIRQQASAESASCPAICFMKK